VTPARHAGLPTPAPRRRRQGGLHGVPRCGMCDAGPAAAYGRPSEGMIVTRAGVCSRGRARHTMGMARRWD